MNNPTHTRHFMLDIETCALGARAAVWQVALLEMGPRSENGLKLYNWFMDRNEQMNREWDPLTAAWTQSHGAAENWAQWRAQDMSVCKIAEIHAEMKQIFTIENNNYIVWCKGASFDFAIMEDMFRQAGMAPPWYYRNALCMRPFTKLAETVHNMPLQPIHRGAHDARDDCEAQAAHLSEIFRLFKVWPEVYNGAD